MLARFVIAPLLLIIALLGGCGAALPKYPPMSGTDALAAVAARQASMLRISAECDLDLVDAAGQRVSLDGVLVAQLPGKVRLRAWKFGQAVFDLTLVDGQGWLLAPDQGTGRRVDLEKIPARQVSQALDLLGASYFVAAYPTGGGENLLLATGPALGRADVQCEIDLRTLTPQRFVVPSALDATSSELLLSEYAPVDRFVWPMRLRLRSPTGEVLVRFRSVEINGVIPAEAFTPPKRAKVLP